MLAFGKPCPGCGLTTGFSWAIRGNVVKSYAANPFAPAIFGLYTASAIACLYGFLVGKRLDFSSRASNWAIAAFFAAYLGFGAYRFATATPVNSLDARLGVASRPDSR